MKQGKLRESETWAAECVGCGLCLFRFHKEKEHSVTALKEFKFLDTGFLPRHNIRLDRCHSATSRYCKIVRYKSDEKTQS